MIKLKPLSTSISSGRVLVEIFAKEETVRSGIVLMETSKDSGNIGVIKRVSEDVESVKPEDTVIFNKYSGVDVSDKFSDSEYRIMDTKDILAIVEE